MDEQKPKESRLEKVLQKTKSYSLFTSGMFAIIFFCVYGVIGIWAYLDNYLYVTDFWVSIVWGLLGFFLFIFAAVTVNHRIGSLALIGTLVWLGMFIADPIVRPVFLSFPMAWLWWMFVLGSGGIGVIIGVIRIIAITLLRYREKVQFVKRFRHDIRQHAYAGLVLGTISIGLGITYLVQSDRQIGGTPVLIRPKDYQIQFRFWGPYTPDYYNNSRGQMIAEQLNKYNATIQNTEYGVRDAQNNSYSFSPDYSLSDALALNASLGWFAQNYPQIKFQLYAAGMGYSSEGNYEGSIYTPGYIKRLVNVCHDFNITNVVGLYSDWEGGLSTENQTMNAWNQALLTDAFAYVREIFPNWTLSCCSGTQMYYNFMDSDMQYYSRSNIFNPMWDDYGPMLYRCGWDATTQPAPYAYNGAWDIYAQMNVLVNGAFHGDASRTSCWLGILGWSCYNEEYTIYDHGQPINFYDSNGFDNLARDILILKSFGCPSVSLFTMTNDTGSGGLFDAYGINALDQLNTMVNGANSTQSFSIWTDPEFITGNKNMFEDFMLLFNNLQNLWMDVAIILVGVGFVKIGGIVEKLNRKPAQLENTILGEQ